MIHDKKTRSKNVPSSVSDEIESGTDMQNVEKLEQRESKRGTGQAEHGEV